MWEDPENKDGGKFVLTMPKKDSKAGRCDEWWLYTVLAIIGETIDVTGEEVCGAVVSIRKSQDRIALWLKSSDRNTCIQIGGRWKKALELNRTQLKFQLHNDGTVKSCVVVNFLHLYSQFSATLKLLQAEVRSRMRSSLKSEETSVVRVPAILFG